MTATLPRKHESPIPWIVRRTRILLFDRDPVSLQLSRSLLDPVEYEIMEATECVAALTAIEASPVDAIIVNAAMSNENALEFIRRVKRQSGARDIPVLALTLTEEDIASSIAAGADDYLIKPLAPRELILRIRSLPHVCDTRRGLVQNREMLGENARFLIYFTQLSLRLASATNLEAVHELAVEMIGEVLGSRRVAILLPDPAGEFLVVAKATGIEEVVANSLHIRMGKGIVERVLRSGEPFIANSTCDLLSDSDVAELLPHIPCACVPVSNSDHVLGVLTVAERQGGRPFSSLDLEYLRLISEGIASALEHLRARTELDDARDALVVALAKLAEYRDNDTGRHLDRVTTYAVMLAQELRKSENFRNPIDEQFVADLARTVPLHDIGKVAIPDYVLLKPAKLNAPEMAIMKRHSDIGAATIRSVLQRAPAAQFLKMAEEVAHAHHEWWNGSGYPRGLKGKIIPLAARITAVADVYDAVTTKRPYKEPMPHAQAVAIIRGSSGTQFDPVVVEAFLQCERAFAETAARLADSTAPPAGPAADARQTKQRAEPLQPEMSRRD